MVRILFFQLITEAKIFKSEGKRKMDLKSGLRVRRPKRKGRNRAREAEIPLSRKFEVFSPDKVFLKRIRSKETHTEIVESYFPTQPSFYRGEVIVA